MKTLKEVSDTLNEILKKWCEPKLLERNYWSNNKHVPCISFEVSINQENHFIIRLFARHDPFGQSVHNTERIYYSIEHIEYCDLENQLLHTLTFNGPYFIQKNKFHKKMEVI